MCYEMIGLDLNFFLNLQVFFKQSMSTSVGQNFPEKLEFHVTHKKFSYVIENSNHLLEFPITDRKFWLNKWKKWGEKQEGKILSGTLPNVATSYFTSNQTGLWRDEKFLVSNENF